MFSSQLVEGHFGLDHPELGQVAGGVGVLGPERGAEGVDPAQRHGRQFAFELARYGEVGLLAEKVLGEVHRAVGGAGRVLGRQRGYAEHLARALGIGAGDDGRVDVVKAVVVEVLVDGERQRVAHAQHRAKGVGAGPQVGNFAQVLQRGGLSFAAGTLRRRPCPAP